MHGSYRVAGDEDIGASGPISHSVRLEPGQTIRISAQTHGSSLNARAAVEWYPDHNDPGGRDGESANASYGFTVTFTP